MLDLLKSYLRGPCGPIILAMIVLMAVSLMAVHASETADPSQQGCTARQAAFIVVGLAGFVGASVVPYGRVGGAAYVWFGLNLLLLVAVLFLPPIRHSHRWIRLGPVQFQPSELAKLTYILAMSWYLRYRENYRRLLGLIPPFVLTLVPVGLILKEPDLGTSLLLLPTLFFMLFMAGARVKHLLAVVGVAAAAVFLPVPCPASSDTPQGSARRALAYWAPEGRNYVLLAAPLATMQYHQLTRIEGWLRQDVPEVRRDKGYQLEKSMIILGSGGLTGGPGAEPLYFRMLPDDHTDFIYAIIGGRWGFAGCAGVLLVYAAIFLCGAEIASMTLDPFGRLLVVGVLALLFAQIFINVGMTMGMMPITGMTLPMISYGGSSMLVNAMALGLVVNVARRRPILLGRRPFEHDQKAPEDQAAVTHPLP